MTNTKKNWEIVDYNERLKSAMIKTENLNKINDKSNKNSVFSEISVLIHNCQGFEAKKDYHKELVRKFKPTIGTWSEIQMREAEAATIGDSLGGYKSISQTPDMFLHDLSERIQWRPKQGASLFYKDSWADKLQKVEVTRRTAIAIYKIEELYLMYIAAYLPTNSNSNEGFRKALGDVRQAIIAARRKYKNFSFIMAGDLNIDQRHDEERRSMFKRFLRDVKGFIGSQSTQVMNINIGRQRATWMEL